jgi:integrase
MKVNIRTLTKTNGALLYVCDYKIDGDRVRKYFSARAEAEAHAKTLSRADDKNIAGFAAMGAAERFGLQKVLLEIKEHGVTLTEVWEGYKKHVAGTAKAAITLDEGRKRFLDSLIRRQKSEAYITQCDHQLRKFIQGGREELLISQLTPAMFKEWFEGRQAKLSLNTQKTERLRFLHFCNWAIQEGHLADGTSKHPTPVSGIRIERAGKRQIRILSPEEAQALLHATATQAPHALCYLVLAMFCGVRPEEAEIIKFGQINLLDLTIDVPHTTSKTGDARIARIPQCAVAWFELAKRLGFWGAPADVACPSGFILDKVREFKWIPLLAEGWQADILRHTAATYRYLQCLNYGIVAEELGNSEAILRRHYVRKGISERARDAFYALAPTAELEAQAREALANVNAAAIANLVKARAVQAAARAAKKAEALAAAA